MKRFLLLCLAALPVLSGGCGYRVGSLMHPQIQTVAVAPVTNETLAYNVASQVRGLLCEAFMVDGSLKLVDEKSADCIVYARVTQITFSESSWSSSDDDDDLFTPNEWNCNLTIEYTVIIPGRATPLVSARTATGSVIFQGGADLEIGRLNGIRQAAYMAAKNVVSGVTEAW